MIPKPADQLRPRQIRTIWHVIEAPSIVAALAAAKVPKRTFYTWLKNPDFQKALNEARRRLFDSGRIEIEQAFQKAVSVLVGLMDSKSEDTKRLAACSIIQNIVKLKGMDIDEKLEALLDKLEDLKI